MARKMRKKMGRGGVRKKRTMSAKLNLKSRQVMEKIKFEVDEKVGQHVTALPCTLQVAKSL